MTIDELPREMPAQHDDLATIQAILLSRDRQQLDQLQQHLTALQNRLQAELESEKNALHRHTERITSIETELETVRQIAAISPDETIKRLEPLMGDLITESVLNDSKDIAEALGPVMGEAIRVQIRDSRQDMVDTLHPIIGETIQHALTEFARDIQRNIEERRQNIFFTSKPLAHSASKITWRFFCRVRDERRTPIQYSATIFDTKRVRITYRALEFSGGKVGKL